MTHQDAHDALADIIWWLKGFNDALQGNGTAGHLLDQAQRVQAFINSTRPSAEEKELP